MHGDYIASGDAVNRSEPDFPQTLPSSETPSGPDSHAVWDQGATSGQNKLHRDFVPAPTFDDPDLLQFQLTDGPYLDLHTDKMYFTLIRFINPETGWAFPSIPDLIYRSKMQKTAVRKYLKLLCEPKDKGGLGKFTKIERENGSQSNAYFLNAFATGLVPEPMNPASDDPLGEALRLAVEQVQAEKDWQIETRDLHIEQLRAQVEALGATPVTPDEPLRHADPSVTRTPPSPPVEPPPPDFSDVDQWVEENWHRLQTGGVRHFIGYREWVRKNPHEIEVQEERWRAEDRVKEKTSHSAGHENSEMVQRVAVWNGPPPEPEAQQLWRSVLGDLQMQLPRPTFETWVKPTEGIAIQGGAPEILLISAPTPFAVEWLERRMFHSLQRTLEKVAGKPMELQIRVRPIRYVVVEEASPQEVEGPGDGAAEGGESGPQPGGGHDA